MPNQAIFTPIDYDNWARKPYFDYYYYKLKSRYTISVKIDITTLDIKRREKQYRFYPTFLYVIMKAINASEAFRTTFHQGKLGHWSYMQPSFTIFHKDDCTFSDLWSEYHPEFTDFYRIITQDIKTYKDVKGIKIRDHQPPNLLPISCIPWIDFESISQDTVIDNDFLRPIIRFGKFYTECEQTKIALSIYVNHAVADGYHTAMLIQHIQQICDNAVDWI
ncbi:CatA-like O-acetyltransferase [Myroides pelagicus]|uniref:Chloramphenicol acetyltransferase CAT n=1 Tax=Myroides pelagicus TaxID=270914 RepID=A0A7K1GK63_9FLAO|nr:CatA-like O-acetyltransferase [Myroides pelagicus]MEC4113452.1 CatA-like O-acetyltransferase [Myroides pelagicus]MTH29251.1 chloramphenicol acetyltransferase CAT [Myroides pelagicus]